MSQKQISEILGIGTSFISQIETGKDHMPDYIPDKLIDAFGKAEVEKYYRKSPHVAKGADRLARKRYLLPSGGYFSPSGFAGKSDASENVNQEVLMAACSIDAEWIDRLFKAMERRDELALLQQREYERQGARIDDILAFLKGIY